MSHSIFLKNFLNTYDHRNFSSSFKNGQFSILNRTTANAVYPGGNQLTDLRLRTDFQAIGKGRKLQVDDSFTDINGYNKELINIHGYYDPEAALRLFARTDFGKRVVGKDIEAQVRCLTHRDSHTAFIYNMLISWGKALLHKMNKDSVSVSERAEAETKVRCSSYKSDHVSVGLPDLNERDYSIEVGPPITGGRAPQTRRTEANYFTAPYVLHYNGSTAEQEWFYLLHVPTRTEVTDLNFDIATPGIDKSSNVILDPVNPVGASVDGDAADKVPWENADVIWSWIIDYVYLNRLQQQFAATLELFGTMFFHPIWSSAEGCVWQASELVAVLSTFSPTRARMRINLEGEPFSENPDSEDYVIDAQVKPISYLVHSAIMNYYMWYGLYSIVYQKANERDDWQSAFTSISEGLQPLYTTHMKAYCIGAILNQDTPTSMCTGAGFYIDMTKMQNITHITHKGRGYGGGSADINIDGIYAPVSGSLILGTLSGDLFTTQHLKGIQEQKFHGTRPAIYDMEELVRIANIYRLFGHQVTYYDQATQVPTLPWAPVNECIIEPSSIHFDKSVIKQFTLGHSDMREGRAIPLPALGALGFDGEIKIAIQRPTLEVICFRTAQTPVTTYVTVKRNILPIPIRVKSTYSYNPMVFRTRQGIATPQTGFQLAKTGKPSDKPEGSKVSEPLQLSVVTESKSLNAIDAGLKSSENQLLGQTVASLSKDKEPPDLQHGTGQ